MGGVPKFGGGETALLGATLTAVLHLRLRLPLAALVDGADGEQDMGMGILRFPALWVVNRHVGAHPQRHKVLLHEIPDKLNLLLPVQFGGQRQQALPAEAGIRGFFRRLHGVPEFFPVLPFLRGVFRQKYLLPDKPLFFRVVMLYPVVIVVETGTA